MVVLLAVSTPCESFSHAAGLRVMMSGHADALTLFSARVVVVANTTAAAPSGPVVRLANKGSVTGVASTL